MTLIKVADAAYPFDYSILPADVRIVLHYIGIAGHTPHVVSVDDVANVHSAGKIFSPIVTVPQRALTARDGVLAFTVCEATLNAWDWPGDFPVFMDIEYSAWKADPRGAHECVDAWRQHMAAVGRNNTHAYGPRDSGFDWVADWTGHQPVNLPPGAVGVQYDHALAGDSYDISVFDSAIFPMEVSPMLLDQDAIDQIGRLLDTKLAGLFGRLHGDAAGTYGREVQDLADAEQTQASLASIQAGLDSLRNAQQGSLSIGSVTIPATITVSQGQAGAVGAPQSAPAEATAGQAGTDLAAAPQAGPDPAAAGEPELPAPAAPIRYGADAVNAAHEAQRADPGAGSPAPAS